MLDASSHSAVGEAGACRASNSRVTFSADVGPKIGGCTGELCHGAWTYTTTVNARSRECCEFAYLSQRGWPFHWAGRGGIADDPDTARRVAEASNWTVDVVSLVADLLVWSYVGLILVVIAVVIRRTGPGSLGRKNANPG